MSIESSESVQEYLNRVGTSIAKEHYLSEINAKQFTLSQITNLYQEGEVLEEEDAARVAHIKSLISGYENSVNLINSLPFVEQPQIIVKRGNLPE